MRLLRINLHIRDDVSRDLYLMLVNVPARPRAELLRRLVEIGLQIERGKLVSNGNSPAAPANASTTPPEFPRREAENAGSNFQADLAKLAKDFC